MTLNSQYTKLNKKIISCNKCRRLVSFRKKIAKKKRKKFINEKYWGKHITGFGDLCYELGAHSVLIYNFALEPYEAQNKLAWAASFILVIILLSMNIISKVIKLLRCSVIKLLSD